MGVKELWTILSPVCEKKSIWELQDKAVAIDLSCWVCDSQNLVEYSAQPRMYLRNLFFRTSCLLLLGAKPVFVLEGTAPVLKHDTMARRNEAQYKSKSSTRTGKLGGRTRFHSILKHCKELLEIMGVPCVQACGEAEALCAQLNEMKMVDGCISQDGDCFLYGAQTVYRNFVVGGTVDVYRISEIEKKLLLSRVKLVALSLLCGCDYNEKGVAGVGKESARNFLDTLEDSEVLDRLRGWRSNPKLASLEDVVNTKRRACHQEKLPKALIAEVKLRRKALRDPDFPSEVMIEEFLPSCPPAAPSFDLDWRQPSISRFVNFSANMLSWTMDYAVEKFVPLVARWQLLQGCNPQATFLLTPSSVKKARVLKGVPSFEVQWSDATGWFTGLALDDVNSLLLTVEPRHLVQAAFPHLVETFVAGKASRSKKGKSKTSKPKGLVEKCCGRGCEMKNSAKSGHLCQFFKKTTPGALEDVFSKLSLQEETHEDAFDNKENHNINTQPSCGSKRVIKKKQSVTIKSLTKKMKNLDVKSASPKTMAKTKKTHISVAKQLCNTAEIAPVDKKKTKPSKNVTEYSVSNIENSCLDGVGYLDSDDEISNLSALVDSIVNAKSKKDVSDGLTTQSHDRCGSWEGCWDSQWSVQSCARPCVVNSPRTSASTASWLVRHSTPIQKVAVSQVNFNLGISYFLRTPEHSLDPETQNGCMADGSIHEDFLFENNVTSIISKTTADNC